MRLLVTRPAHKAAALGTALTAMGHQVVVEPLLDITMLPLPLLDPAEFGALVFTSANGITALSDVGALRGFANLPAYCVGPATAAAASDAGFAKVFCADGDGLALAEMIVASRAHGALLHIKGRHSLAEPGATLARAGFSYVAVTGYEAHARLAFSKPVASALKAGEIDAVLLYSPRSAVILAGLLEEIGVTAPFTVAFCLSSEIAAAAASFAANTVHPSMPNEQALLDLLTAWEQPARVK
ncbi:MAG: uroporphyrinogen-III synthase [Alphaproteobacteria bacterium]